MRIGLYQHHGAVKRTRATDEQQDPGDFTFLNEMFLAAKWRSRYLLSRLHQASLFRWLFIEHLL